jgi:hypothetical protein
MLQAPALKAKAGGTPPAMGGSFDRFREAALFARVLARLSSLKLVDERHERPEFPSTAGVLNSPSHCRRRRPIMRRPLSLGLLLVGLSALPASAGHGGGAHVSFSSHPHFARNFNHFNGFNRFNNFNGSFGSFGFAFNSFDRFGRSRSFTPSGWGWGWGPADWDNWDGWTGGGGAPGTVIVLAGASPTAYAAPPPPAKATVETEAGVTVFRGPGSHHLR